MSRMTELASGAITAADTVTIELGEADETSKATLFHPRRFRLRGSDKTGTHGSLAPRHRQRVHQHLLTSGLP